MKKGKFTQTAGWKIFLYILLAASAVVMAVSASVLIYIAQNGAFDRTHDEYMKNMLRSSVVKNIREIVSVGNENGYTMEEWTKYIEDYGKGKNLYFSLTTGKELLNTWNGETTPYEYKWEDSAYLRNGNYVNRIEYTLRIYVDPEFRQNDDLGNKYLTFESVYVNRDFIIITTVVSAIFTALIFVWLMCLAGHNRKNEGITTGYLNGIYLEIITLLALCAVPLPFMILDMALGDVFTIQMLGICIFAAAESVIITLYCQELATRLKAGTCFSSSLICRMLGFVGKMLGKLWRIIRETLESIPILYGSLIFMTIVSVFTIFYFPPAVILLLLAGCYCTVCFNKLNKGIAEIANGNIGYKMDVDEMLFGFGKMERNINKIADGMAIAVDERIKSERMKTELITNVSHDIRTPLTSIINYSDLISREAGGDEKKLEEYARVIYSQSNRLKKLLDDLLEVSKASSGNLELNLQPCEVGVMISQAVGEYGEKLDEAGLTLKVTMPDERLFIKADGRYLWRIFENLINNICKYALTASRVYINVESTDNEVSIIFRNMSKYELNITSEELMERFVRGDSSRHMEGNGLGLSIAKNLAEVQNGRLDVTVDGDLFKVTLVFPRIEGAERIESTAETVSDATEFE